MPNLPTRLARKWCLRRKFSGTHGDCDQCHAITAAIREALEAAEKAARDHYKGWDTDGERMIAVLAALREGRG